MDFRSDDHCGEAVQDPLQISKSHAFRLFPNAALEVLPGWDRGAGRANFPFRGVSPGPSRAKGPRSKMCIFERSRTSEKKALVSACNCTEFVHCPRSSLLTEQLNQTKQSGFPSGSCAESANFRI